MKKRILTNERGIALITALLISLAISALVTGMAYVVIQSTGMSGAGKRYATAEEAATGAVNVVKDTINLTMWGEPVANVFPNSGNCQESGRTLASAITNQGQVCTTTINLPSTISGSYTATITVQKLYQESMPGGRIEFARGTGGAASTAIYFRITATVTGRNNTRAETSALYRFAG